jgi:hypothetical protein
LISKACGLSALRDGLRPLSMAALEIGVIKSISIKDLIYSPKLMNLVVKKFTLMNILV